ncbi:MAG: aldo/keto reductase [Lachnospiraceae bacterium]|jgi:predicted aldo/keto reductase-like oxidoreductase|nr:aldo/keto reductase [Lachnospiraceae bacterium]
MYFGEETPKLGFGLMRLPKRKDNDAEEDVEQVKQMVDLFLASGLTYFDTAYVYDGGKSEEAIKKALVERHPRGSYTLATKLNAWMGCTDEASAKQEFYTSLERTGAGYFDYYLLHALQTANYEKYDEYHLWDFLKELKAKGLVRHYGFSFHAGPDLLDKLLTAHPDVDFVQLQINYADWENPAVQSRANWEMARKHGKSVVIMEPVKGGTLAQPPERVKAIFDAADPKVSTASWAIRFAASLDGVITVLSGMSNLEQMQDNVSYMKDFKPLTDKERDTVEKARRALLEVDQIPCTACHYCTPGCPEHISIPDLFSAMNQYKIYGDLEDAKDSYGYAVNGRHSGKASDCVKCGQCEAACPQQLPIRKYLEEIAETLE